MVGWLDGWMVGVQSEWIDVKAGKLNALGNLIHHHYIIHLFVEIFSSSFYPFTHSFPSPLHSIIHFPVLINFYSFIFLSLHTFIHFPVLIHFHSFISLSLYTFIHTFPCSDTLSSLHFPVLIHFHSYISLSLYTFIHFPILIHFSLFIFLSYSILFIHFSVLIHFQSFISLSSYTFIHTFPCANTLSLIHFPVLIHFHSYISMSLYTSTYFLLNTAPQKDCEVLDNLSAAPQ